MPVQFSVCVGVPGTLRRVEPDPIGRPASIRVLPVLHCAGEQTRPICVTAQRSTSAPLPRLLVLRVWDVAIHHIPRREANRRRGAPSRAAAIGSSASVGVDNRVKTVESLRFTVVAEPGRYMATHHDVLAELRSQGVDVVAETNRWGGPGFRGINVRLRVGPARRFEVQLHTRESFEAAKATRGLHEEYRLSTTPPDRRAELFALLDNAFAQVSVPPGAIP